MKLNNLYESADVGKTVADYQDAQNFLFDDPFKDDLILSESDLTSLVGSPKVINFGFDCSHNRLVSLEGGPEKVGTYFDCISNKLTTLKGAPNIIKTRFRCSNNELTSFDGGPAEVGTNFVCFNNNITSLKNAPSVIGSDFHLKNNKLKSLIGVDDCIKYIGGEFDCSRNPITEGGLGFLLIDVFRICSDLIALQIIQRYINKPEAIYECQKELIEAGYEAYAQL